VTVSKFFLVNGSPLNWPKINTCVIKRRGKLGLIKAGADINGIKEWLGNKLGKEFHVS
jgi:hypothetical protein